MARPSQPSISLPGVAPRRSEGAAEPQTPTPAFPNAPFPDPYIPDPSPFEASELEASVDIPYADAVYLDVSPSELVPPTSAAAVTTSTMNAPPPQWRPFSMLLLCTRLGILGVGLGAIAATSMAGANLDPVLIWRGGRLALGRAILPTDATVTVPELEVMPQETDPEPEPKPILMPTQAIASLQNQFSELAAAQSGLEPGAFFYDLDTGEYVNFNGDRAFSAASTIKVPVLVAFFQALDRGEVQLDELLTMTPDLIGGGSGAMQYQAPGTQFTALETATQTIVISDNTATNMLIHRLGGADVLNAQFQDWGLTETAIRNPLPDLDGTNTTSPQDMVRLLARVERGELLSLRSRDRLFAIMERTKTKTLLPRGLGPGATIAHKTGDIGSSVGDVGAIDLPTGKRYLAAVLVARPHNDSRAQELIRNFSRRAYEHFINAPVGPLVLAEE
ncbi:beta-lactamase class A [Rubidibacter lacunae KORDI 51-2]|uniref:Beta-lactamase class A n=1 Tax=Rubidibacter lacunae KORDI 51-2 TaxID=582515 RepID=U5D5N7_9CHRO|nr:class A beta-lactamase [Rubidibacter lacunae]ERN39983.1 beta-lactamase class A [Rubidibacter lacunae KORDI 51-2]